MSFHQNKQSNDDESGLKALLVLYTRENGNYKLYSSLESEIESGIIPMLSATKAENCTNDVRFYWKKTSEYDLFVVVGIEKDDKHSIRKSGSLAYKALMNIKASSMVIPDCPEIGCLVEGAFLASFTYDYLKKKKKQKVCIRPEKDNKAFKKAEAITKAQNFCRFLSDTPSNLMTPKIFVAKAEEYLSGSENIEINAFDRNWVEKQGMGLFISVSNGSSEDLKFLEIKYRGRESNNVDIALVGKGITFDSGGICLKPSSNMSSMKMDMAGAASVLSVVGLVSKTNININMDVFIPLCENLPSGHATKPGDVFSAMDGTSVEIDNTDAEGRLILAEALLYAQKFDPRYIINVATLTGAISVSLGSIYCGLFCNDDDLANLILISGEDSGDLVWRMPLDKRYKSDLDSDVADIKNCGSRYGGACIAASFLNEFVRSTTKWAHIDIAGVMNNSYFKDMYGKGSTGSPVRLLYNFVERVVKNGL